MNTEDLIFELPKNRSSAIKVIGVGGGGSNAVNYMYQQGIEGVDFMVCNTDAQALNTSPVPNKVQLGLTITEGMGAGANPEIGEQAALESLNDIKEYIGDSTKMVFITAGMGGGTGTGAAPVIAELAKEMGILTVGIVTAPFYFEGKMRLEQAEKGVERMQKNVDSLIVVNNDKLRELYGNLGYKAGFAKADEVLTTAAKGIAEVISKHYATNIDLHDARTVLADSGTAIMGTGVANGEEKAKDAVTAALDSPLLNNNKISGAQNVLLLIVSGDNDVTMDEIGLINEYIQAEAGNNANIIMGVGEDIELGDKISVTVIATGFPTEEQVFTGREEEKVVHVLEEEKPLVRKLSIETPVPVIVKKTDKISDKKQEPKKLEEKKEEIKFFLEDEENTITPKKNIDNELEPELKPTDSVTDETETVESAIEFEPLSSIEEVEETTEESTQTFMFSLDDDYEIEEVEDTAESQDAKQTKVQTDVLKEIKIEIKEETEPDETEDPTDLPISETLSQTIEERRARLRMFNHKFKSTIRNKSVDEVEAVPAYKRKGVELNEREENHPSDFIVSKDSNDDLKIRPNNFLHDNVD